MVSVAEKGMKIREISTIYTVSVCPTSASSTSIRSAFTPGETQTKLNFFTPAASRYGNMRAQARSLRARSQVRDDLNVGARRDGIEADEFGEYLFNLHALFFSLP